MRALGVIAGFALLAAACGEGVYCDAGALAVALEEAGAGTTISVGPCAISGRFTVRSGVSLEGEGRAASRIESTERTAVILEPGARLARLAIHSSGSAAIYATGAGAVTVEDVSVEVELGTGVAFEDLTGATLARTEIRGPINETNAFGIAYPASHETHATHGLILLRVSNAALDDVSISGFAMAGAALVESIVDWQEGQLMDNLTVGMIVEGGSATLGGLELGRALEGTRGLGPFNAVFTSTATIESTALSVIDGEGHGLLQDTGSGRHLQLSASNNRRAAVWSQSAERLEVSGALSANFLAGVVAIDTGEVRVHDAQIDGTRLAIMPHGALGLIEVGDGIQLVRAAANAELSNLTLNANERVGILIELDGAALPSTTLAGVSVATSSTGQRGVVAQGGTTSADWDSGVTRTGVSATEDQAAAGTLDPLEGVGPCGRPIDTAVLVMGQLGP